MLEALLEFDEQLFQLLNGHWHNSLLDTVMPFLRNKYFWSPLYLFIISFLWLNYKRKGLYIILFAILTIVFSDQISSHLIKPLVGRLRPCQNIDMQAMLRLLVPCGAGKSFVSAHATNHFALAIFFAGVFRFQVRWLWVFGVFWASMIAYGQVYVGVHYPIDVFFGALLGVGIGLLNLLFLEKIAGIKLY